jgi:hypothetical protein
MKAKAQISPATQWQRADLIEELKRGVKSELF